MIMIYIYVFKVVILYDPSAHMIPKCKCFRYVVVFAIQY